MKKKIFKFLQYNILSHEYAVPKHFVGSEKFLPFKVRSKSLKKTIQKMNPDICCMQEIHTSIWESWMMKDVFPSKYFSGKIRQKYRESILEKDQISHPEWKWDDGVAIVWRKEKFQMIDSFSLDYVETARKDEDFKEEKDITKMATHNVGMAVLLEGFGSKFWVATTHLHWNWRKEWRQLYQMYCLLRKLEEKNEQNYPMIIAGDLNNEVKGEVCQYIGNGKAKLFEKKISHNLSELKRVPLEEYGMTFTERRGKMIDHVFHTSDFKVSNVENVLKKEDIKKGKISIPNKDHPSDHLCLSVEFEFTK